jgi:pimeloyl-ACP methyl ester carboxylesterase
LPDSSVPDSTVVDPIATFIAAMRAALAMSGLTRHEEEGRVWFSGGTGDETIVLIHGVNDQAGTWAAVVPALAAKYRLIVPDLAGHGESAPVDGPIDLMRIVDDLAKIIDRETSRLVTLVGNSMGGWMSMLYALRRPTRVTQLVLEDSSGMSWPISVPLIANTREQAAVMMRAVNGPADATPEFVIDAFLARANGSPMLRVMQTNIVPHMLDGRFGELSVPVKLIWGKDDGVLPLDYAEALQKKIEGAELHVIDGAAHIPHRQQPERFIACLTGTC